MLLHPKAFQRLCRARDMLSLTGEDALSVRDLARQLGVSPFQLIRQFEAVFGLTPHQFRTRSRVDRAKELLALGPWSVTAVCMEVGFSSLGSFSDLFTRRVGTSPSGYRKRAMIQVPRGRAPDCLSLMGLLPETAFAISEKREHVLLA
jgi:AraC-like DNA-binding protein